MEDMHTLQSLEAPAVLETEGWWTKYSCAASGPLSQRGSLSHDTGQSTECIFNPPPLDRKGSSYQARLSLCERIYGEIRCPLIETVALWGYIGMLCPTRAETKVLRVLSPSVFSVIVYNPYLLESQTHQIQMVVLCRRCSELSW